MLARLCWALALLTEVYRRGPAVLAYSPLRELHGFQVSAGDLLSLAPATALDQLAGFRQVLTTSLLPELADYRGRWRIGPTFTGSQLMRADADLVAGDLLLELKTTKTVTLSRGEALQWLGYALLDFNDDYGIRQREQVNAP